MITVPADLKGSWPRLEWKVEHSEGEACWEKGVGWAFAGIFNMVQQLKLEVKGNH